MMMIYRINKLTKKYNHYIKLCAFICFVFLSIKGQTQTVKTIGGGGANYSTLKLAFDAINAGSINGTIVLQITGSTTEGASAVLNASGVGSANYTSVTIYPTVTGYSISGNLGSPLIDLSGADNVTIDGRVNASGGLKDLTITNTNTGTSSSTIRFIKSATNNIVKYCTIKGSATSTSGGIVFFSTASTGTGNDNNLIDNNNITADAAGRCINAVYSVGSAGYENTGNTISNNYIYDFWLNSTAVSNGVEFAAFTNDCSIIGNSFYETTTVAPAGFSQNAIYVSNTGNNNIAISGNYIGGASAQCGGTALTFSSGSSYTWRGIYINAGSATATSIQGNTIKNISITSPSATPFYGIQVDAGLVNIGTTTGNTIGSGTGTGSISITGSASLTSAFGINISTASTVNCNNNILGSITTSNGATKACSFYGIYKSNSGTTTLNNNTIGSTSESNSINVSSASSGEAQVLYGIYSTSTSTLNVGGNVIAKLTNSSSNSTVGTAGVVCGIAATSGTCNFTNNIIRDLTNLNANTSTSQTASVLGIALSGSNSAKTISGNIIYNLTNTYASFAGNIIGIYFTGNTSTNTVARNFIHSFSASGGSSISATFYGIKINAGACTYSNNIISLGGNTLTNIYGVYDSGGALQPCTLLFNTVYIGGTLGSGTNKSYALYSYANSNTRDFRNNIFCNSRSTTGGSNLHYAVYFNYATNNNLTLGYNDYYTPGTGGVLGYYSGNVNTLPLIATIDGSSVNTNPLFSSAGGTDALNYYATASLSGVSGTTITTDYSSVTRGATPKMGALEANSYVWQGGTSTDFATASNWTGAAVPPSGADIAFAANPDRSCLLDGNRTVGSITNAQSDDDFVVNGYQLTITGSLSFSGGAQIDATTASSVVIYAGTAAQSIPSGAFVSNTVDALTLNNAYNLTLNGSLIVNQNFTLTNGSFLIGANTITLNGAIVATSGTLTGGSTSNLSFGGSGALTTLPAITLNNLTINRSNGINLSGSVSVGGTLTLTAGTLTLGANALTISGSSPVRTAGGIDASNASATVIFSNTSAITLPASVFSAAINNLTLSGAGGVTSGGDLTVNGILNLAAANPSTTKGLLEMTIDYANYPGTLNSHFLNSYLLNMGALATTTGIGDVTGMVKRSTIAANTPYTFGHELTSVMITTGTLPDNIKVSIMIGTAPTGKSNAVQRVYEIIPSGGSGCTVNANFHYLDTELNGNTEANMVTWDYDIGGGTAEPDEHGRSNYDFTNNYLGLSNVPISYFIQSWRTVFMLGNYAASHYTWNGASGDLPTTWNEEHNWTPNGIPNSASHVIIPDASSTPSDPILPSGVTINTMTIQNGGILTMGSETLTIQNSLSGGWEDQNPLGNDPGTSKVVFSRSGATVSGNARFYNVEIATGADITNQADSRMKIANVVTKTGAWYADTYGATIEYNGADQTIVVPDGTPYHYHNLTLSGSGTKTMPATALTLHGNLTISGTASVTAASNLSISGDLIVNNGATFVAGAHSHTINGNLTNDGTFTGSSSTVTMSSSSSAQSLDGTPTSTTLYNLTTNNTSSAGVLNVLAATTINNQLDFDAGLIYAPDSVLTMGVNALTILGVGNSNYINGYCRKVGNTAFTFPIGDNGQYAPISISNTTGTTVTNHFVAKYFNSNPGVSYNSNVHDNTILNISYNEYWMLNRKSSESNSASVTLSWAARSGVITHVADLTVAHWNGSSWKDEGAASTTGNTTTGTITSNVITSFSPITLATETYDNPLPVELILFDANCNEDKVDIRWQTASETNNDYFEIQVSDDARSWNSKGVVKGAGNSNNLLEYFYEIKPEGNASYCRLKQVDYDGKYSFSNISYFNCLNSNSEEAYSIYPVPSNHIVNVSSKTEFVNREYNIINQMGQIVQIGILNGINTSINIEHVTKGFYYLKIEGFDNKLNKLIVE